MNDQHKSKKQLIYELSELRQQLKELETAQISFSPNSSDALHLENESKMFVENSADAIIRLNQSMGILFANSIAIEILGIPVGNYVGKTPAELNLTGYSFILWKIHIEKIFITKQSSMFEAGFTNYKGHHYHYRACLVPEFTTDGSIQSVLCTFRNISHLKKVLSALRASEKRNKQLLAALPDLLMHLSNDGICLDFHAAHPTLVYTPLDERLGKHISQVLPAEPADKIMAGIQLTAESGKIQVIEYQLTINNILYFFEGRIINFNTDSVLMIVRNISELIRLKQELSRLDHLYLVGEMAASIGHEVRNPMTTVRGYLQLFSSKSDFTNYKETFNIMIEELDRANTIISEFLSLAKNKAVKLEQQNLNTIIHAIAPLIQSTATISNKSLKLDLEIIPDLLLDAQEIRQLILNLVNNGLESMSPDTVITIKTFIKNNKIVLAIQDMGSGIPPELMDKLGTPFFTTKEQGTGLGLAICYSIVARHKATIEIATNPQGTTFFITFDQ
ncbi:MAG: sensor signal transduction histidine kinase [Firmicutes bacterium]|nr:sensor signal transduction histidine kinase [Bacillota bacterium]